MEEEKQLESTPVTPTKESDPRQAFLDHYKSLEINNIIDHLRYMWFLRKVKRNKVKSLWEGQLDKTYFEQQFADELSYDDGLDRNLLAAEMKKEPEKRDFAVIENAEFRIAKAKAIKGAYKKTCDFIDEVKLYIRLFDNETKTETKN